MSDPIATAADFVRILEAKMQEHLSNVRLTLSQYGTLSRIHNSSVAELAAAVGVSQQMVSKTVRDLKLLGYVGSTPADDGRRRMVYVTPGRHQAIQQAGTLHLRPLLLAEMATYVVQNRP